MKNFAQFYKIEFFKIGEVKILSFKSGILRRLFDREPSRSYTYLQSGGGGGFPFSRFVQ